MSLDATVRALVLIAKTRATRRVTCIAFLTAARVYSFSDFQQRASYSTLHLRLAT
jgi:hypothetical protein